MFSTLPQIVCDEGWRAWEAERMQCEDLDAPLVLAAPRESETTHDADSEMSCLSAADSPSSRRQKLDGLAKAPGSVNPKQVKHLQAIKRKAQKAAHDQKRRNKPKGAHLDDLLDDITSALSCLTLQTRESDGKFGQLKLH